MTNSLSKSKLRNVLGTLILLLLYNYTIINIKYMSKILPPFDILKEKSTVKDFEDST